MYNVQDYSVPYNKAVQPVICEGLHSTHTWKARGWPHHSQANHLLAKNLNTKENA